MTAQIETLVVKATSGTEDPERCAQAFMVAATAVSAGLSVSLWLTGEASWFALPGRAEAFELAGSPPLEELLMEIIQGGRVTLCTQCAGRRGIGPEDVRPGIRIAGSATFVSEIAQQDARALVY